MLEKPNSSPYQPDLTVIFVKNVLPTARLELAIFGLGDRRLIHWATRAAYIRGGETMICQKALPLQVRLVVSCQHLSRLYNLTFSKLHLA